MAERTDATPANELTPAMREMQRVISFAESVPERYRDRVFDALLSGKGGAPQPPALGTDPKTTPPDAREGNFVIPARVKAFMGRNGLVDDQIRKLVLVDQGEVHFIHEPTTKKVATGQIQWALLQGLKSALTTGEFLVDPEDVRSVCIAKGFYDKSNFASNFKRNGSFFSTVPVPQGEAVRLSPAGETELASVVKELLNA